MWQIVQKIEPLKKNSRQKFEFAWEPVRNFSRKFGQNAKNLGSVAPVGSKIAPIMLEIKFYLI